MSIPANEWSEYIMQCYKFSRHQPIFMGELQKGHLFPYGGVDEAYTSLYKQQVSGSKWEVVAERIKAMEEETLEEIRQCLQPLQNLQFSQRFHMAYSERAPSEVQWREDNRTIYYAPLRVILEKLMDPRCDYEVKVTQPWSCPIHREEDQRE